MIVPADRRGFALSVVVAGLTASTALGSPTGALIEGFGDWRWTMVFVAGLAAISAFGVGAMLAHVPPPPKISLPKRIAPLADPRIGLTLATTLLTMSGIFIVYTYFAVVFAQLTAGASWLQKGGVVHEDHCIGPEDCVLDIFWPHGFDVEFVKPN